MMMFKLPETDETADKAWTSTLVSAVCLFVLYYIGDKGAFTQQDFFEGLMSALIGSGLVGGATWFKKNRTKSGRRH